MSAKTHTLDTIHPEIHFKRGANVNISKRNVRLYEGKLCVSARGRLYAVTVTGPKTCACDLGAEALLDFGGRKEAREKAQAVAPVATLAKLGIDRPSKSATPAKASANDRIDDLATQVAALSQAMAAFMTHES